MILFNVCFKAFQNINTIFCERNYNYALWITSFIQFVDFARKPFLFFLGAIPYITENFTTSTFKIFLKSFSKFCTIRIIPVYYRYFLDTGIMNMVSKNFSLQCVRRDSPPNISTIIKFRYQGTCSRWRH